MQEQSQAPLISAELPPTVLFLLGIVIRGLFTWNKAQTEITSTTITTTRTIRMKTNAQLAIF